MLNDAAIYYHNNLLDEIDEGDNKTLLNFLADRKITTKIIKDYQLGYALDGWDNIAKDLDICKNELQDYDLIKEGDSGKQYDFFRNRLMFPIRCADGETIAFSGRDITNKENAKFMNSTEKIYSKKTTLMGLDTAIDAIYDEYSVIVVEGNLDVYRMQAMGFKNTVCPCGTALSMEALQLLFRLTPNVILLFDGDKAGKEATDRIAQECWEILRKKLTVAKLPNNYDPDKFLLAYGSKQMIKVLDGGFTPFVRAKPKPKEKEVKEVKEFDKTSDKFLDRDQILRDVKIENVISSYLTVKNNKAICPFHDDTNASLSIHTGKQIFQCFTCGTKGNAIDFIMEYQKVDFLTALKTLKEM